MNDRAGSLSVNMQHVDNDHLSAMKHMSVDTIAYYLNDHPETRAIVEMLLESERRESASEYSAGLGTTPSMWELLSDVLEGQALPDSLNNAIYALCEGRAKVIAP